MASTHILNSHSYDGRYLQVSLTQTADAANRRSKITGTVTSLAGAAGWYATGPTTVTVAGIQRYSRARESSGTGQSNKNFVGTIAEFYVDHDTSGNASVSVSITTAIYASATQTTSNTWTLDSIGAATTACGAPTACTISSTLSESNVTLSWSGASSGTNNSISSYEIQYSESSDNATWGAWTSLTTVTTTATSGSTTVSPSSTRGYYRRFQVRTRGAAGASYYSGWKVSTNSVRKNTLPSAPSTLTASPATYSTGTITLSWSGAAAGTSAIKQYNIEYCTSTDGTLWGSWAVHSSVTSSATSGSSVITPTTVPGTYTKYRVYVTDTLGATSAYKESNSIYCSVTACGAPTSFSLGATLSEGTVLLSWSGATNGAGNNISSYEIQYSESNDNVTWGSWIAYTTVTSTSGSGSLYISPSSTRGYYRRFQIRTCGSAGSTYYSPWKISGNTVRKNTLPTTPTTFTALPAIYETNNITLTWNGAVAGTSAIKHYLIQYCTSSNNTTWTAYETLTTITSSATSGSLAVTPSAVAGMYTRYRICVVDALDAVSAYVTSGVVKKNSPPGVPTVTAPKAGSATYNPTPRFLIKTGIEPDGQRQKVAVKTASGAWEDSIANPAQFSKSGYLANSTATVYLHPATTPGSKTVTIVCQDEDVGSSSADVVRGFTVLASPFTTIIGNETKVKSQHITALRTAVNTVRNYYGLAVVSWVEEVVAGKTPIRNWPFHIMEIRKAIEPVVSLINSFDSTGSFGIADVEWIPITPGRPNADITNQLQELILTL